MKQFLIVTTIIISSFHLLAQTPQGGMPQNKAGMSMPAIGRIYGKLVDSAGKPVSEASVILLNGKFDSTTKKVKEVLIKGGVTSANGEFSYEELPIFGHA